VTSAHTVVTEQRLSLEYDESVIVCVVKLGMINSLYSRAEPAMNSDALAWISHILVATIYPLMVMHAIPEWSQPLTAGV